MIAARQVGFGKAAGKRDYTAKDYIQDGLVAMWDGIENAGWGVHSNDVGLKNLVGNVELSMPANLAYMSMGDKSLDINLVNSADGRLLLPANSFSLSTFSVEICISRLSTSVANAEFGLTILNGVTLEAYTPTGIRVRTWNGSGSLILNYLKTIEDTSVPHTMSLTYDGGVMTVYLDGSYLTKATQSAPAFNSSIGYLGNLYLLVGGSIYGARISDRALTAEEITHNYNIDRQRFVL